MEREGKFINVDGVKIHYQTRGSGPLSLLLIHGAVGSFNDFAIQLDRKLGLDERQFSLVALDLPGHGQSELGTPKPVTTVKTEYQMSELKCEPTLEYFEHCAEICASLMRELGRKTYSVAGWNDGARVASLLAVRHEARVDALILWGFAATMDRRSCWALARTRDINTWDQQVLGFYTSVYGEQNFSDQWRKYVDFIVSTLEQPERCFDVRDLLCKIKCPTLILYGSKDPIIDFETHVKPLEMQIYDSDIVQFRGSAHNIHQANPSQFNETLSNFVVGVQAC